LFVDCARGYFAWVNLQEPPRLIVRPKGFEPLGVALIGRPGPSKIYLEPALVLA